MVFVRLTQPVLGCSTHHETARYACMLQGFTGPSATQTALADAKAAAALRQPKSDFGVWFCAADRSVERIYARRKRVQRTVRWLPCAMPFSAKLPSPSIASAPRCRLIAPWSLSNAEAEATLNAEVVPMLTTALMELCKAKPENPILWLGG